MAVGVIAVFEPLAGDAAVLAVAVSGVAGREPLEQPAGGVGMPDEAEVELVGASDALQRLAGRVGGLGENLGERVRFPAVARLGAQVGGRFGEADAQRRRARRVGGEGDEGAGVGAGRRDDELAGRGRRAAGRAAPTCSSAPSMSSPARRGAPGPPRGG